MLNMTHQPQKSTAQHKQSVETYLQQSTQFSTTQQILDSGAIPALKNFQVYAGKVSDCIFGGKHTYYKNGQKQVIDNPPLLTKTKLPMRIMIRTTRISSHDIVRAQIPFKDQVLALNHQQMKRLLQPVLGHAEFDVGLPATSVITVTENLQQIPFENVIRNYMAKSSTSTSLYQHYMKGERHYCGHDLAEGLVANGPLPYPMDTPTTKAEVDVPVSPQELFDRGICTPAQYTQIRNSSLLAFGIMTEILRQRGIIAVDTKTEHGIDHQGRIVCQDEIWTLDSSRFWLAKDYQQQLMQLQAGKISEINPESYSKEFARGFSQGKQGYTEEQCIAIAVRYIEGIEHLLQIPFVPDLRSRDEQVIEGLRKVVEVLL